MDNTVNDLRYESKFENRVNDKNNLFIKQNILFWTKRYFVLRNFFKFLKNLIALAFFFFFFTFFAEADIKNMGMPRQKPLHLPAAEVNFERCTAKTYWLNH